MQCRRPAPLSDQLFAGPVLLGTRRYGAPLPVKNTFVDLPSGFTPTSTKGSMRAPLLTAPAWLHKEITIPADYCLLVSPLHANEASLAEGPEPEPEAIAHSEGGVVEPPAEADADAGIDQEDDESEDEATAPPPAPLAAPRLPPGVLHPSIGSEGHVAGVCKRCCFFARNRCTNGYDCAFCHYEHERRKRKNKKSKKTKPAQLDAQPSLGHVAGQACIFPASSSVVYPYTVVGQGGVAVMGSSRVMHNVVQAPLQGCFVAAQQLSQPFPQHLSQQLLLAHISKVPFGMHIAAHSAAPMSYIGHAGHAGQAIAFVPAGSEIIPPPPSHVPRFPLRR